jgi:hypothetical protein
MLFNSIEYFIFLPIVIGIYWITPHLIQNRILLAASYLFYGLWDIRFLFLIILSTCADYLIGLLIQRGKLTLRQILKSSIWLFFSAIAFLATSWSNVTLSSLLSTKYLAFDPLGVQLLTAITLFWPVFIYLLLRLGKNKSINKERVFFNFQYSH